MRIENKVTLAHLKQSKNRTIITILGVCISVAMISAIVIGSFSFLNVYRQYVKSNLGDYHFSANVKYDDTKDILQSNEKIESYGYQIIIPKDESGYKIKNATHNQTAIGTILAGDKQFFDYMIFCKLDGRYPQNANEIMIEKSVLEKNHFNLGIGDEIEIATGTRKAKNYEESIISFDLTGEYKFHEVFLPKETKRYKIVGILHNNNSTFDKGNLVLRGIDKDEYKNVRVYGKLNRINLLSYNTINNMFDDLGVPKNDRALSANINEPLLMSYFAFEKDNAQVYEIAGAVLLLLIIIMITAIFLIKNAFSMSYAEKVKYLGMLSSVGATKQQILYSVIFEGVIIGVAGSVLGFLTGLIIIASILKIASVKFISTGILNMGGINSVSVYVPLISVLIIFVFSIITVVLSIISPARKSLNITAIDAIRQAGEINNTKAIRKTKLISTLFGYEGELAYKNLKRNGRKSRIIILSVIFSVVLLICGNYFCSIYAQYTNLNYDCNYQVWANVPVDGKNYKKQLKAFEEYCNSDENITGYYLVSDSFIYSEETEEGRYVFDDIINDGLTPTYKDLFSGDILIFRNYIDDVEFDKLCKDNGINPKSYYTGNSWVVMNNISLKKNDKPVFKDSVVGKEVYFQWSQKVADEVGIPLDKMNDFFGNDRMQFGELIDYNPDNYICNVRGANCISTYAPISRYLNMVSDTEYPEKEETGISYEILSNNHTKTMEKLQEYFEGLENGDGGSLLDYQYYKNQSKAITTLVKVFMYFFIIMIMVIAICNIINTINNSIVVRTKEFAMLQSVGVAPSGFTKMIVLESLFYSFAGLIISLPISVLVCFGINKISNFNTIPFQMNWLMCIVAIISVVSVITSTMMLSTKKIRNNNIIEVLKKDAI